MISVSALRKDGTRLYFHVYNRGVGGQNIFNSEDNYRFLLRRLNEYSEPLDVIVIAYCLMPTHYHLLIEAESRKRVSRFVQKLFNSYSQAFNQQQNRTGTLFESRAKFKGIETDSYAVEICAYIHLNPVKAGLVTRPDQWKYSNYAEWVRPNSPTDRNKSLRFFESPEEYAGYIHSSLMKGQVK